MIATVAAMSVVATPSPAHHRVIRGDAVYYADHYVGQTMACGGTYRHSRMVAAHRSLACGTRVKITNRSTGKTVRVTVRDRGPYGDRKLKFDVSRRAAKRLGMVRSGRAPIKAVVLHH